MEICVTIFIDFPSFKEKVFCEHFKQYWAFDFSMKELNNNGDFVTPQSRCEL